MSMRATSSHSRPVLSCLAVLSLGWACFGFDRACPAQVKADDVATVLASMRQAAGRPVLSGRPVELLIEGKVDREGLTSDFSLRFAPAGMFLETLAGPLAGPARV